MSNAVELLATESVIFLSHLNSFQSNTVTLATVYDNLTVLVDDTYHTRFTKT